MRTLGLALARKAVSRSEKRVRYLERQLEALLAVCTPRSRVVGEARKRLSYARRCLRKDKDYLTWVSRASAGAS